MCKNESHVWVVTNELKRLLTEMELQDSFYTEILPSNIALFFNYSCTHSSSLYIIHYIKCEWCHKKCFDFRLVSRFCSAGASNVSERKISTTYLPQCLLCLLALKVLCYFYSHSQHFSAWPNVCGLGRYVYFMSRLSTY